MPGIFESLIMEATACELGQATKIRWEMLESHQSLDALSKEAFFDAARTAARGLGFYKKPMLDDIDRWDRILHPPPGHNVIDVIRVVLERAQQSHTILSFLFNDVLIYVNPEDDAGKLYEEYDSKLRGKRINA